MSEDEAHRVLARAVELDTERRAGVSAKELQQAAEEAGIAREAFEQALAELKAGELEPVTIGHRLSAKLADHRRAACVASLVLSAGITPGDSLLLSVVGGLGLYAVYEGAIAVARHLGRRVPPRMPPLGHVGESGQVEPPRELPSEGNGTHFVGVLRRHLRGFDPSAA